MCLLRAGSAILMVRWKYYNLRDESSGQHRLRCRSSHRHCPLTLVVSERVALGTRPSWWGLCRSAVTPIMRTWRRKIKVCISVYKIKSTGFRSIAYDEDNRTTCLGYTMRVRLCIAIATCTSSTRVPYRCVKWGATITKLFCYYRSGVVIVLVSANVMETSADRWRDAI